MVNQAERYLSAKLGHFRTHVERYGKAAVIGGITMLALPNIFMSFEPEGFQRTFNTVLVVIAIFASIIGLLAGGAVATVFGKTDDNDGTQGVF